jgi:hypothetical protein
MPEKRAGMRWRLAPEVLDHARGWDDERVQMRCKYPTYLMTHETERAQATGGSFLNCVDDVRS